MMWLAVMIAPALACLALNLNLAPPILPVREAKFRAHIFTSSLFASLSFLRRRLLGMVHADAAFLPAEIKTKSDLYAHLSVQLGGLLDGQRSWVSNLSNASSVLFHTLNNFPPWSTSKRINWAGFYLMSPIVPGSNKFKRPTLVLGPFHGLPACQSIQSVPGKGVCADASSILPPRTVKVNNTEEYPGHIACDSASMSEIVVPIIVSRSKVASFIQAQTSGKGWDPEWQGRGDQEDIIIGVLDIDCEAIEGFDEEDVKGLEAIVRQIADACDW